jgi:hypothetical protein
MGGPGINGPGNGLPGPPGLGGNGPPGLNGNGPPGLNGGLPGLGNLLPGVGNSLQSRFGSDAGVDFGNLLNQGNSVAEAFTQSVQFDPRGPSAIDPVQVANVFDSLPQEVQQAIVNNADALPQPVRDVLDNLGITQPQTQPSQSSQAALEAATAATNAADAVENAVVQVGRGERAEQTANAVRTDAASFAAPAAQAQGLANAQGPNAVAASANPLAAQQGTPQAAQFAGQVAQPSQAERTYVDATLVPQGMRGEGFVGAARDPGNVVVMADRMNAAQQQMQAQTAPSPQGRPDALPMQAMATLAGATMLASPQANPLPGQVTTPSQAPGTDAAAAHAREAQLAPAGHTIAGFLRRDLRRGTQPLLNKPLDWSVALLPGLRKRRAENEDKMTSFQWLFWILTIVAYGSIGIAIIALIPGGGGLTDRSGQPSTAGYALLVAGVAAIAAWVTGRRLAKDAANE